MDVLNVQVVATVIEGLALSTTLFLLLLLVVIGFCGLCIYWILALLWRPHKKGAQLSVVRVAENPVLRPIPEHWWESEAVFNPAAFVHDGRVHLLYRALGQDGISRIGHASSLDGIHFDERAPTPIFQAESAAEAARHYPYTSPARLTYDTVSYASGGGWGGAEDPRAVMLDDKIYMTFNLFNGWSSMSVAYAILDEKHLSERFWKWTRFKSLSRPGERHKNWMLFPEKINGKFALLHSIYPDTTGEVRVSYMDELDCKNAPNQDESPDPQKMPDQVIAWHTHMRSASAPPIKTAQGWLVFYTASDRRHPDIGYKVGVMLLDLTDPTKVLARSKTPVLEPLEWYENDWKPGVVYASGAVVFGDDIILYYGGGDKYIAAAKANYKEFLHTLCDKEYALLHPVRV